MPSTPTDAMPLNLTALIERLEKADGPDREIDALIQISIFPEYGAKMDLSPSRFVMFKDVWEKNRADHINHANNVSDWWKVPNYTASIDAAVSLAESAISGVELEITNLYSAARVTLYLENGTFYGSSEINSIPLSLCLATLRALSAQEGSK